jgi:hypothetical protein
MMGTDTPLAARLPGLYRAALDAVDELARRGGRRDAARLRAAAAHAYSRAWDDRCCRVLEHVIRDAHAAAGTEAPSLPLEGAAVAPFG